MKKSNVTLKDIAAQTDLSANTVSLILRGKTKSIPESTCERVKKAADKLGYTTNLFAVGLRKGNVKSLAVINYNYTNPFYTLVTHHLAKECNKSGYNMQILIYDSQKEIEDKLVPQILSLGINGIFSFVGISAELYSKLKTHNITIISVGSNQFDVLGINSITFNDLKIGRIATEYLINNGRKNLLFLGTKPTSSVTKNRLEGFKQCLELHNMPCTDNSIFILNNYENSISNCLDEIYRRNIKADGIFCYNDELANAAMVELIKRGKSIPDEIMIIGCDNIWGELNFLSILPTVNLNKITLAKESMRRMLELLSMPHENSEATLLILDVSVVANNFRVNIKDIIV